MSVTAHTVKASWFNDAEVTLQVDSEILTPELACEINAFWSDAEYRVGEEDGCVQRAVLRMFGVAAIRYFMASGGISFGSSADPYNADPHYTEAVIAAQGEGWPDAKSLGILITAAEVPVVDYADVELEVS